MYERSIDGFGEQILDIKDAGRNASKVTIQTIANEACWEHKIALLSGQRFDDIGIAKKSAIQAVNLAFDDHEPKTIEEDVAEAGSVTEAVMEYDPEEEIYAFKDWQPESDRIDELFSDLEELEEKRGDRQKAFMADMIESYSEPWVVVFSVLDDMSLGISHNTICNAVAEDKYTDEQILRGRALITDSVEFVRSVKQDEDVGTVSAGTPFAPMKAKSVEVPDDSEDWLAQVKLDGYRCIIHVKDGKAQAFSSSLNETTRVLPELEHVNWPSGEWIFDTEVMADDGKYSSTSERMQRKKDGPVDGTQNNMPHTMNFWVFDILMVNGNDVSRSPFADRIDIVFENVPMSDRVKPVHAFEDIAEAKREAQRQGYEGLIVKHKGHEFEFGQRSKKWIKDKLTTETVDLRIGNIIEGTGRHAGRMGAVTLVTEDGHEMGKVGTGFSDEERELIWDNKSEWSYKIVEIKFDVDEGYEDGLRFPAFEGRRDDKMHADDLGRVENIAGGDE